MGRARKANFGMRMSFSSDNFERKLSLKNEKVENFGNFSDCKGKETVKPFLNLKN